MGHACGPATAGAWNTGAGWVTKGSRTTHACDPYVGDMCNAVKVSTAQTVKYLFAPAIGIPTGSTGAVQSVACYGACKPTGSPLDIALVLDRTGSMSAQDIADVKNAALELLKVYNASQQDVALLALPYPAGRSTSARLRARRTTPTLRSGTQRNGSPSPSRTTTRTRPGTSTRRVRS